MAIPSGPADNPQHAADDGARPGALLAGELVLLVDVNLPVYFVLDERGVFEHHLLVLSRLDQVPVGGFR